MSPPRIEPVTFYLRGGNDRDELQYASCLKCNLHDKSICLNSFVVSRVVRSTGKAQTRDVASSARDRGEGARLNAQLLQRRSVSRINFYNPHKSNIVQRSSSSE